MPSDGLLVVLEGSRVESLVLLIRHGLRISHPNWWLRVELDPFVNDDGLSLRLLLLLSLLLGGVLDGGGLLVLGSLRRSFRRVG